MDLVAYDTVLDLKVGFYRSDPTNIALQLIIAEGEEMGEPYCDLTVNLGPDIGNAVIMPRSCGFVDTHDFPAAERFIKEHGLGEPYTRFGSVVEAQSGFVTFPLYSFNEAALKELDPVGFERYAQQYDAAFESAREAMFGPGAGIGLAGAKAAQKERPKADAPSGGIKQ